MTENENTVLLEGVKFQITIERLCRQLIEHHNSFEHSALLGLQPRGTFLAEVIHRRLSEITGNSIRFGKLDATFHRDDFRSHKGPIIPSAMQINFSIEGLKIILIDDVLFTGRTIRSGLDALVDLGRPQKVELLVLVDRRFSRHLPIQPDYTGIAVDTRTSEKVKVTWSDSGDENSVWLIKSTIQAANDIATS